MLIDIVILDKRLTNMVYHCYRSHEFQFTHRYREGPVFLQGTFQMERGETSRTIQLRALNTRL